MSFPVLSRVLVTAFTGALVAVASLAIIFTFRPDLSLEMDRDYPRLTSGFYPVEVHRDQSFAWTGRSAVLRMPGADRRTPWICSVRFRGARSAPLEQPVVELAADGITLGTRAATNDYQVLEVTVPPRPSRAGLLLTVTSSTTFVPGPADSRELGVQVDSLSCLHATVGLVVPPRRALIAAATCAAAAGAGLGFMIVTTWAAIAGTVVLGISAAIPLASGPAPYSAYLERAGPLAFWIFLAAVAAVVGIERWRRQGLSGTARFAIAFSASALFIELLALLHPSKLVIDAVFHAHRFEWVQSGRYYFTQPMPDGVQFPYAIGLYLFALPWSLLTHDHVTLLRIIVSACHALAGALLYPMAARVWNDRAAGAAAVLLFHLVRLPYIVIGNANMTYSFGQSAAFVALAAAVLWSPHPRRFARTATFFVLTAIPFLSHVGVFPVLFLTLAATAVLYWIAGQDEMPVVAHGILWTAALAAIFAVVTYYGQFSEVYKSLERVRGRTVAAAAPPTAPQTPTMPPAEPTVPRQQRARTVAALALRAFGWPVLLLAGAGLWQLSRGAHRDRLTLALAGAAAAYVVFVAFAALTPVQPRFQRYSDEFIDRMNYAATPIAVLLAGRAISWSWRAHLWWQLAVVLLLGAAMIIGVQAWYSWLT